MGPNSLVLTALNKYDPIFEALNDAFVLGEISGLRSRPFDNKFVDEELKKIKERYFV